MIPSRILSGSCQAFLSQSMVRLAPSRTLARKRILFYLVQCQVIRHGTVPSEDESNEDKTTWVIIGIFFCFLTASKVFDLHAIIKGCISWRTMIYW